MKGLSIKPINCYQCESCYEKHIKEPKWDIERVMSTVRYYDSVRCDWKKEDKRRHLRTHTVHGGDPLLLPFNDLHTLLRYCWFHFRCSNIQTNLMHMTDRHVELFKKYNTSVGVSVDGFDLMNKGRFPAGTNNEAVSKVTAGIWKKIERLKFVEKVSISIMITMRKYNCAVISERSMTGRGLEIERFLRTLYYMKINSVTMNICRVNDPKRAKEEELSNSEVFEAYKVAYHLLSHDFHIRPLRSVIDGLLGHTDGMNCSFTECDPWCTPSEVTLNGDGSLGSCLHAGPALDGIQGVRPERPSRERYELLPQVPQNEGGCKHCVFWHMCKGGCPSSGINGNYLNKTRFCEGFKKLFKYIYYDLKAKMPNAVLTPDFYPELPDEKKINSSIAKSTWRDGLPFHKMIAIDGHNDSDKPEWRELNKSWYRR